MAGSLSRGREWDLPGSQAIRPVPLPRSKTPAGLTTPRQYGVVGVAPANRTAKAPAFELRRRFDYVEGVELRVQQFLAPRLTH
jgi:hypothetical protein